MCEGIMFCTECGTNLPNEARFCTSCGTSVYDAHSSPLYQRQGHCECKEVTHTFEPPLTVELNQAGLLILTDHVSIEAKKMHIDLRGQGWEPDKSFDGLDLWNNTRIGYEREKDGFLRKREYLILRSVT